MKTADSELKTFYEFYGEFWGHIKKHYGAELTNDEVNVLIADTNRIGSNYSNNELCKAFLLVFLAYKDGRELTMQECRKLAKRSTP